MAWNPEYVTVKYDPTNEHFIVAPGPASAVHEDDIESLTEIVEVGLVTAWPSAREVNDWIGQAVIRVLAAMTEYENQI